MSRANVSLTIGEAAERLAKSVSTLQTWKERNYLSSAKTQPKAWTRFGRSEFLAARLLVKLVDWPIPVSVAAPIVRDIVCGFETLSAEWNPVDRLFY